MGVKQAGIIILSAVEATIRSEELNRKAVGGP